MKKLELFFLNNILKKYDLDILKKQIENRISENFYIFDEYYIYSPCLLLYGDKEYNKIQKILREKIVLLIIKKYLKSIKLFKYYKKIKSLFYLEKQYFIEYFKYNKKSLKNTDNCHYFNNKFIISILDNKKVIKSFPYFQNNFFIWERFLLKLYSYILKY